MKMGSMWSAVAACAAAVGITAGAAEAGVIDQAQELHGASFNMDASVLEWQQEITVGLAGLLTQIDVYVSTTGSSTFYLNVGAPWQDDPNDFEMLFVGDEPGWHSIDVSSAGLNFNAGDHFVIGWDNIDGGLWLGGHYIDGGDPYPAGDLYLNGVPHTPGNNWDLAFRTYVIPAPGAVLLLGLAGLVGPSRRRR
jgi:hypothetical protein